MYLNPQFIKTVPPNVEGRDFVVGDLHGCFDELAKLLMHVKFDVKKDRLFSTGDLIDRGPRSKDCLTLLSKDWFFAVLGNHEDLILSKFKAIQNGENHNLNLEEKELIKFLPNIFNMPLVYEIEHLIHGKIYIVHSEILPEHLHEFSESDIESANYDRYTNTMKNFDFSAQIEMFFNTHRNKELPYSLKQKLIWSRKMIGAFYKDHKKSIDNSDFSFMQSEKINQNLKVFCGHNVIPFPMKIGQQYYIDTGCALGYSSKELNSYLFSQFGHEFFTLSMVDLTTGVCYGCVSSQDQRGKILKLDKSLYE